MLKSPKILGLTALLFGCLAFDAAGQERAVEAPSGGVPLNAIHAVTPGQFGVAGMPGLSGVVPGLPTSDNLDSAASMALEAAYNFASQPDVLKTLSGPESPLLTLDANNPLRAGAVIAANALNNAFTQTGSGSAIRLDPTIQSINPGLAADFKKEIAARVNEIRGNTTDPTAFNSLRSMRTQLQDPANQLDWLFENRRVPATQITTPSQYHSIETANSAELGPAVQVQAGNVVSFPRNNLLPAVAGLAHHVSEAVENFPGAAAVVPAARPTPASAQQTQNVFDTRPDLTPQLSWAALHPDLLGSRKADLANHGVQRLVGLFPTGNFILGGNGKYVTVISNRMLIFIYEERGFRTIVEAIKAMVDAAPAPVPAASGFARPVNLNPANSSQVTTVATRFRSSGLHRAGSLGGSDSDVPPIIQAGLRIATGASVQFRELDLAFHLLEGGERWVYAFFGGHASALAQP